MKQTKRSYHGIVTALIDITSLHGVPGISTNDCSDTLVRLQGVDHILCFIKSFQLVRIVLLVSIPGAIRENNVRFKCYSRER